jgi:hypothetical protein
MVSTKSSKMVSTNSSNKFVTVASVVVRNHDHPGLPPSRSGDGLVILGYGWSDFYLAWMPLGNAEIRLRDTLYYIGTDQKGNAHWDPNIEKAVGLFGTFNRADANQISMAWVKRSQSWILLYTRLPAPDQRGYIVARLGSTPWSWSDEIPIVSPNRTSDLYDFITDGSCPYGPKILNRFTEWDPTTRELGIYYLVSIFKPGYQIHLMYTKLRGYASPLSTTVM